MTETPGTPAGWFPDTEIPGGQRYWDGSAWTEHRQAPVAPPVPTMPPPPVVADSPPPPQGPPVVPVGAGAPVIAAQPEKKGIGKGAKIAIGVVAALVILIIIAAIGGGSKDTPAAATSPTPTATETPASSASASDTPTPDATPTETPTPTEVAAPVIKPITYKGSGNKVLKIAKPDTGAMLITTTIKGPSDNNTIYALDADLNEGDLLVNTIGSYRGTSLLDASNSTETTRLKISVSGSWVITIAPISSAREITSTAKGNKDDVLLYRADTAAIMDFKSTSGDSNVTAYWITGDGSDLLVNDIGKFSAQAPMTAGPGLIQVSSDGSWTVKIAPA